MITNGINNKKILCVFDFDYTIIDDNSDTIILNALKEEVPQEIKKSYKKGF